MFTMPHSENQSGSPALAGCAFGAGIHEQTAAAIGNGDMSFAGVAQLVEHRFCKPKVRGSSPLASSDATSGVRGVNLSEGCPSGQREQAVNLPAYAYVGSNPTPSTNTNDGTSVGVRAETAGVAQLVERQPSKLNVASSNLVSRSAEPRFERATESNSWSPALRSRGSTQLAVRIWSPVLSLRLPSRRWRVLPT